MTPTDDVYIPPRWTRGAALTHARLLRNAQYNMADMSALANRLGIGRDSYPAKINAFRDMLVERCERIARALEVREGPRT